MKEKDKFKLIDGVFKKEEAQTILGSLFDYKINFHNKEILSTQERNGSPHPHSESRIQELKMSKENLKQFLAKLEEDTQLKIESNIEIKIIKTKP
jgi:hypothetical protein